MSIQKRFVYGLGWLVLALSEVGMAQTTESLCQVRLHDRSDYQGQIQVRWSSELTTTFEFKGTDKWLDSPLIKVPANIKEVQIEGSLTWNHYLDGKQKSSGSSIHHFVDFTPVIRNLRSQESWGLRMDKFVKELVKLENKEADRDGSPSEWIESSGPVPREKIKAAEQRLKFALPDEHRQLLQDYGAWSYSESFCVAVEDLDRADKQMISIWGSPASEFATLSAKNKALYQASVMLYVESGDGYGALIYHPNNAGGDYYWIHQDNLDEPTKLVDSQDKPRDYSSTMRWLIANQILFYYDDTFSDSTFIDRSSTTAMPYQLRLDFPERTKLEARLEVDWSKFE